MGEETIWKNSFASDTFPARIRKGIRQGLVLGALGIALGAALHETRQDPLPWIASWSPESVAEKHLRGLSEAPLEEAWTRHQEGRALFLDARDPASYQTGHLPGALNIPPSDVDAFVGEVRALAEAGMAPMAYCDGVACSLSAELARAMEERGVPRVKVLVNGWSRWKEAGYPVEGIHP